MSSVLPAPTSWLSRFPWASLGRKESSAEFLQQCEAQRDRVRLMVDVPEISLAVALPESVEADRISHTLSSLVAQTYPHWRATVIAGSSALHLKDVVSDSRIHWVEIPKGLTLAEVKNVALDHAGGVWWGSVDAGDVLSPAALYQMVVESEGPAHSDVLYTNEAIVDDTYRHIENFFSKPEFSWFDLIHFNYVGRFWLARTELAKELRFRAETGLHHEQDLLLRLCEQTSAFKLVPFFHYYSLKRARHQGAAAGGDKEGLRSVVAEHLRRKKLPAEVSFFDPGKGAMTLKVSPYIADSEEKLVSIVICFRNRADWTLKALEGVSCHVGRVKVEVFLVNNQSERAELQKVRGSLASYPFPIQIVDYDHPFNYAAMHNLVVQKKSKGQFLLFLNNDVFWEGDATLDDLVAWAQFPWAGTVGIRLRYPHGAIQHGGFQARFGGQARLARIGNSQEENRFTYENKEVYGNTFAACLVRRDVFDAVGGLKELEFANGFGDVVFNFECLRRGLKNLYLGHVYATHMESASRGMDYEYWEECGIERRYPDLLQKMLRCDLGYNRVPDRDFPFVSMLRQAVGRAVSTKLPWLAPFKPSIKKMLRELIPTRSH